VLEVIYLVFNEGYTATAGEDWMRPALMDEAMCLGHMLAELSPNGKRSMMDVPCRTVSRVVSAIPAG
jgi:predicted RNA polymerase sigma factor